MKKNLTTIIVISLLFTVSGQAQSYSDFASELVSFNGDLGPSPYNDPCSVLGEPASVCKNLSFQNNGELFKVKLIEPAYNIDANNQKVITTINAKEYPSDANNYIIVKFDHKVVDYPGNLYGIDFVVFGNSYFTANDTVSDSTNMNTCMLAAGGFFEKVYVSVAQDVNGPWYSFDSGPFGDDLFPTQAYKWDRANAEWTEQKMDFTKPIDPNLDINDFANISAADAIDLYNGSGGGTGFDLQNLTDYNSLSIDPNNNYRWIQYIRFEGGCQEAGDIGGEIDAVADAAACGDPTHPWPVGDINKDCVVDLADFALLSQNWLECSYGCD